MSNPGQPKHQRIGVLDIGSNSVRFVIYELFGAAFSPVYNEKVLAGLGRDLNVTGNLSPSGKIEAIAALKRFKIVANAQSLDRILIGATAALRDANDAPEFIKEIFDETGLNIEPLTGKQEAELSAKGLLAAEPRANGIAADLGGASLELIKINEGKIEAGRSFPLGPFQVAGTQLAKTNGAESQNIRDKINSVLDADAFDIEPGQALYIIGGAWRNLAGIHQERHLYPMKTLQAYELMPGTAQDLARWAYGPGRDDILSWPGVSKKRADTLPYAGLLLDVLMDRLKPSKIIVSATGLRAGLVYDALPKSLDKRDALLDGCQDLASGNLQGLNFAQPLLDFLKPLDAIMPKVFDTENENRLRKAACHLVGIGKGLHADYRADLVFEDVLYAPLSALTHKERAYLALILFHSYTGDQVTPNQDAINLLLTQRERHAALVFGTAMRLAVVASGRSGELLQKLSIAPNGDELVITAQKGWEDVLTKRVTYRLTKLGNLLRQAIKLT